MSERTTVGGFAGDPAAALSVTGSGSCCGGTAQVGSILPPPGEAATGGPCCGTREDARVAGSCCGTGARAEAVDAGQGCCG